MSNRPFSKLAAEREVRGDTERRTGVYTKSHEDSSTVSTKQFSSAVEFRKRSGIFAELSELIEIKRFAPNLNTPLKGKFRKMGNHISTIRGRGMDLSEIRNYQAGDEIRHMEWRVTARTGRPHVKLYQEEKERPTMMLVDFNPSMLFGTRSALKSVIAARLAALLAWSVVRRGDKIGGLAFSAQDHYEFMPKARECSLLPILSALSQLTQQNIHQTSKPKALSEVLIRLRRVVKPGSTVILISDFYSLDASCDQHLRQLRNNNDILLYHICDPLELHPPQPGFYAMTDGHSKTLINTRLNKVKLGYDQYCHQRIATIQEQCKKIQAPYIQVTALDNLSQIVRLSLSRGNYGNR